MLEKSRFLTIKKIAREVRRKNENVFKAFATESMEDAIREKEELIESVLAGNTIEFSEGEQGKEEKQIFRANLLIPDDQEFFETYTKDKNIRNLMNKYAVSIEDIMSKITELNIYGKYIEEFNYQEPEYNDEPFVNEMIDIPANEADSLLGEIEDLSDSIDDIVPRDEEEPQTEEQTEFNPAFINDDIEEENSPAIDDSNEESTVSEEKEETDDFDDISNAVSDFVDEYSHIQEVLNKAKEDLEEATNNNNNMKEELAQLKEENETLRKNNLESANSLNNMRSEKNLLENENITLKEQIKVMDKKIKQSAELLKRIYNSIPKR